RLREYQDVVQIDNDYTFCYELRKDVVHHGLESGRAVGKAKKHNQGFKQPPVGSESGFPFVSFLHVDIIKPPTNIKFSEVFGAP
ncbi:hypothetical protein H0H81_011826, partial [Sphagnurus paluster]